MVGNKETGKDLSGIGKSDRQRLGQVVRDAKGSISVSDAAKILNVSSTDAAKLLSRVYRGVYVTVPLESRVADMPLENAWGIADKLFSPCYIGGWSAAENWGLTEQIFRKVMVMTTQKPRRSLCVVKGTEFLLRQVSEKAMFGLKPVWQGQVKVSVSDPSRTVVDMFGDPTLGGGIRSVSDRFRNYLKSENRNIELLLKYAKQLGNGAVFKRLGFMLERFAPQESDAIGKCLAELTKGNTTQDWIFKGGTCLKKCYFETYRFSEDLNFTLIREDHLHEESLTGAFREIADFVYDSTGLEIPKDLIKFEVYRNPRGKLSAEGKISYRGPMQQRGNLPCVKLDLTADEIIALPPVLREVQHPYSDRPPNGIIVQCYGFEEVFAEKIRALTERLRPRDLYDVIHLYHHSNVNSAHDVLSKTLKQKCDFKGILPPTAKSLAEKPERIELEAEWSNMLAHQLPALPPFEQFWQELPAVFEWLYQTAAEAGAATAGAAAPIAASGIEIDTSWQPPAITQAWRVRTTSPLHIIRFAAANHLCVNLQYQGSSRLIEPYSLRMTKNGDLLLYAVKHNTQEDRSYRVDRIGGV